MKPADLYKMTPESITTDLSILFGCYYSHVPEVEALSSQHYSIEDQKRIQIRFLKYFDFDGRRFWALGSVWFDDFPIMVIQNAGREGDDWARRYVTNPVEYKKMVDYLMTLYRPRHMEFEDQVDPNVDVPKLDEFYGNKLTGHFERY